MLLTTKDRYFAFYPDDTAGAASASFPAQLDMRIASVSRTVERYLERNGRYAELTERTQTFTPDMDGTRSVRVMGYPIESIESVTVDGDLLVAGDDYIPNSTLGVINFSVEYFPVQAIPEESISVIYTGGMAEDTAAFVESYPDIESAVLTQVNFELTRYKTIANKSISNGASSSSMNHYGLLDEVIRILDSYSPMPSSV